MAMGRFRPSNRSTLELTSEMWQVQDFYPNPQSHAGTSCGGVGLLPTLPGGLSHGSRSQVQETLHSRSPNHPQGSWRDQSPCPKSVRSTSASSASIVPSSVQMDAHRFLRPGPRPTHRGCAYPSMLRFDDPSVFAPPWSSTASGIIWSSNAPDATTAHQASSPRRASRPGSSIRTTKQFRQPANPGNKTDDTDLAAIQRAAVNGFGLLEPPADPLSSVSNCSRGTAVTWSRRASHCAARSMNIFMRLCQDTASVLKTSMMRGFAVDRPTIWLAAAILQAGVPGLIVQLRRAEIRVHQPTLEKILAWARSAPAAEDESHLHLKILTDLDDDRLSKVQACVRSRRSWRACWSRRRTCS